MKKSDTFLQHLRRYLSVDFEFIKKKREREKKGSETGKNIARPCSSSYAGLDARDILVENGTSGPSIYSTRACIGSSSWTAFT